MQAKHVKMILQNQLILQSHLMQAKHHVLPAQPKKLLIKLPKKKQEKRQRERLHASDVLRKRRKKLQQKQKLKPSTNGTIHVNHAQRIRKTRKNYQFQLPLMPLIKLFQSLKMKRRKLLSKMKKQVKMKQLKLKSQLPKQRLSQRWHQLLKIQLMKLFQSQKWKKRKFQCQMLNQAKSRW